MRVWGVLMLALLLVACDRVDDSVSNVPDINTDTVAMPDDSEVVVDESAKLTPPGDLELDTDQDMDEASNSEPNFSEDEVITKEQEMMEESKEAGDMVVDGQAVGK